MPQTIFGIFFIFFMTTLGSAVVFFFKKKVNKNFNKLFLGFASGVMIAASIWSLLLPSMESAEELSLPAWLPAVIGFILGGLFLLLLDRCIPHVHAEINEEEGPHNNWRKTIKLFMAVMIHNIPEGLAIGLAFGAGLKNNDPVLLASATGLSIGMGLQNFPEGAALSLPIKEQTGSRFKGFMYGMLSGAVEPIFAVIGIVLATTITSIMPWALAFAAGAMIYVVVEELIPEAHLGEHSHFGTWGVMIGFIIMMVLDVALG